MESGINLPSWKKKYYLLGYHLWCKSTSIRGGEPV